MSDQLLNLRHRVRDIPESLQRTYQSLAMQRENLEALAKAIETNDVDIAGIGGSLLPAEYLRNQLELLGFSPRQREASCFLDPPQAHRRPAILIVFSQGLSPNAQLAFAHQSNYVCVYVICASHHARNIVERSSRLKGIFHAPLDKEAGLVRIQGPINACLVVRSVLDLIVGSDHSGKVDTSSEALRIAQDPKGSELESPLLKGTVAFLSPAKHLYAARALAWRVQECMQKPGPAAYDFLAFAHGPLQAHYNKPARFVYFENSETPIRWKKSLEAALNPELHELAVLTSTHSNGLEIFDWDLLLWPSILKEMSEKGINPYSWAGQNKDASLYELGRPVHEPNLP